MKNIFFDSWDSIIRTVIVSLLAYVLMIVLLRVSGKRTLSKMNAFDFIVTIALGSTLATIILSKDVALIDGVVVFFMLIYLQYLITTLSVRSTKFNNLIKSTPTLLVYKGEMLKAMLVKERVSEDEIFAVLREKGLSTIADADAVVLETDGTLTVVKDLYNLDNSTMSHVKKPANLEHNH